MKRLGAIVACVFLGATAAAGGDLPTVLHFDPFAAPDLDQVARGGEGVSGPQPAWSPVLRATLMAGAESMVNLGGTILKLGDEAHGYQLVDVQEGEASFLKGESEVVLSIPLLGGR